MCFFARRFCNVFNMLVLGPPGPMAGVYIDDQSVTSYSARVIWTVGLETKRGRDIISFDVEGESHFHPGVWKIVASGTWIYLI